jgi:CRP-like cAMP-binding protein/Fe-S-cluster-containing hydrogenase component 2
MTPDHEHHEHHEHQPRSAYAAPVAPVDPAAELARLKTYPFLAPLAEGTLKRLQPNLSERRYLKGETILRSGEYSDTAFFLKDGIVEVRMTPAAGAAKTPMVKGAGAAGPATPAAPSPLSAVQKSGMAADGTVILSDLPDVNASNRTLLEPGELFGEINALARYALSSDVVAHTDVVCLAIRTPALRALFKQPELAAFKEQVDNRYRQRTLGAHLRQVDLFAGLSEQVIDRLRQTAELLSFEPGAVIVPQGAPADAFYLVRGGYVKVAVKTGAEHDLSITYLRKGDYAGEISLLLDEPWPFSLEALEYVELVRLSREAFQQIVRSAPAVEQKLWEEVVRRLKERGAAVRNPLASQYLQMAMDTGLIHGESVMLIDMNLCTRCDDCVRACASVHDGTPRFIREGNNYRHWMVPNACYQCSDPACLVGCPTGAITRPLGTREVTINPNVCIACHNCSRRCPWGNIIEVPFESPVVKKQVDLPTKCDQCIGRSAGPACVQICPHGALTRISFKDMPQVVKTFKK